jgi:hypothetical protein
MLNSCVKGREVKCFNAIAEGEGPWVCVLYQFFRILQNPNLIYTTACRSSSLLVSHCKFFFQDFVSNWGVVSYYNHKKWVNHRSLHPHIWVTWRVSCKKQEQLNRREHLGSPPVFLVQSVVLIFGAVRGAHLWCSPWCSSLVQSVVLIFGAVRGAHLCSIVCYVFLFVCP